MVQVTEEQVLQRMRKICAKLPECESVTSYGHPALKARGRLFAVLEWYKKKEWHEKKLSLCVKVGLAVQDVFLKDERFYRTPYIGHLGWVSLDVNAAPVNWEEVRQLIIGSYKLVTEEDERRRRTPRRRSPR